MFFDKQFPSMILDALPSLIRLEGFVARNRSFVESLSAKIIEQGEKRLSGQDTGPVSPKRCWSNVFRVLIALAKSVRVLRALKDPYSQSDRHDSERARQEVDARADVAIGLSLALQFCRAVPDADGHDAGAVPDGVRNGRRRTSLRMEIVDRPDSRAHRLQLRSRIQSRVSKVERSPPGALRRPGASGAASSARWTADQVKRHPGKDSTADGVTLVPSRRFSLISHENGIRLVL
jgi:hypothetical protein